MAFFCPLCNHTRKGFWAPAPVGDDRIDPKSPDPRITILVCTKCRRRHPNACPDCRQIKRMCSRCLSRGTHKEVLHGPEANVLPAMQ